MEEGKKYRVEFWSYEEVGERIVRTRKFAVMKYLGQNQFNRYLQFDLRPLAGTQELDEREVIDYKVVDDETELQLPKKV